MIDPGKLDQRITFEQKVKTRSGIGEELVSWQTVATVWAEAVPVRGREQFAAEQMQQIGDVTFRIRARTVEGTWRVMWRGQPHDIVAVVAGTGPYRDRVDVHTVSGVRDGR